MLNETFRKIGKAVFVQVALACALPLTIPAQNLVQNPGFEKPWTGVPPGTDVSYTNYCAGGKSAAGDWTIFVNTCGSDISTTLVPSTAPDGGNYMIHVVTNGLYNGLVTQFASKPQTLSSAWVYLNSGCIGIGTGNGGNTIATEEMTCLTGQWIQLYKVPNGVSPANEFIVYSMETPFSTSPSADFYVDNVRIFAATNP